MTNLKIERIRMDGGTQPRAILDEEKIKEYAELMEEGVVFPDVSVVYDGTSYWLVDGFHRVNAAMKAGKTTINSDVQPGTQEDAVWISCGVNAAHGVPRNNADKKRAAELALAHPKARNLSDVQIAKHCGTSSMFIGNCRRSIIKPFNDNRVKTATRDGKTYKMDTGNIGKKQQKAAPSSQQAIKEEEATPAVEHEQPTPTPATPEPVKAVGVIYSFTQVWSMISKYQQNQINTHPGSMSAIKALHAVSVGTPTP